MRARQLTVEGVELQQESETRQHVAADVIVFDDIIELRVLRDGLFEKTIYLAADKDTGKVTMMISNHGKAEATAQCVELFDTAFELKDEPDFEKTVFFDQTGPATIGLQEVIVEPGKPVGDFTIVLPSLASVEKLEAEIVGDLRVTIRDLDSIIAGQCITTYRTTDGEDRVRYVAEVWHDTDVIGGNEESVHATEMMNSEAEAIAEAVAWQRAEMLKTASDEAGK